MNKYKSIFILLILIGSLAAQNKTLQFENISTFQGLSDSRAKCIFQDSFGYLWIGTYGGGLIQYDGYSFKTYKRTNGDKSSIINNTIHSIAEDADGNLWIGTGYGLSHYIRENDNFKRYNLNEFENIFKVTVNAVYEVFTDSKNRIWAGTAELGTLRYDSATDKFIMVHKQTSTSLSAYPWGSSDFTEDKAGIIWATSTTDGLVWYDQKQDIFRPEIIKNKENKFAGALYPFRIYADSENNIWMMTNEDLYKYLPSTKKIIHLLNYTIKSPLNLGYEGEMWEDSQGNMWVVHINLSHPIQFPKLSNEFIEFDTPNIKATDIYFDSFGTLWISDWDEGLHKHVPNRQSFHQAQGKIENSTSIEQIWIGGIAQSTIDTNLIYLGTDTPGWLSFNKKTGSLVQHHAKNYKYVESENKMAVNKDGTVWMSYWGEGLAKWSPRTDEFQAYFDDSLKTPNLHNARVASLQNDASGALWIGTYKGLFRLSPDGTRLDSILVTQGVTRIFFNGHILWLGTHGAGLLKYDLKRKTELALHNNRHISNKIIWDIYADKNGFLWIATEEGLVRFDPVSEQSEIFDVTDGFAVNYIVKILPGENGDLWMSTSNGISRFHIDSLNRVSIANYDSRDGLAHTDFRWTNALKDKSGRMYFGGKGLTYFSPQHNKTIPPRIHIKEVTVNGKTLLNSSGNIITDLRKADKSLVLEYHQNTISFNFITLHTAEPKRNRSAYFLEGYDSDWKTNNKHEVQYLNLEPGSYKFHLRGANQDGIWNSEELILPIIINPPIWQTVWAYLFYLVMFFGSLYSFRKFEINRQKKNAAIKEGLLRAEAAEFQAKAAEAQSRAIQAENDRKSQELEEARQLQLSMLPKELPKLQNLDIAVYMQTATEVGGDYYDFSYKQDGSLNIALGDATGHGTKAGIMVSSMKSIFSTNAPKMELEDFFASANSGIKSMQLKHLMMGFTMLNIQKNKFKLINAGMPPVYLFHKTSGTVKEITEHHMPIGAMNISKYKVTDGLLEKGDVLLLLSDGMPELQNEREEMYGYKRIRDGFESNTEKNAEEMINYLKGQASAWLNDKDPDDDVTFVVIKVK